ncbi:hypothetical protein I6B53_02605 [Schaalia sp. 19OD2882]|uniref:hypothetical protein n=1 Tax=Schaalia sp. 19OD2882 TaxID=2794089 RepID=UPI001C1EF2B3|nr:hypothetical protein [Schaalia sp. 19OD2882]QWW20018.1 hypothetical protein I6B53_02605 [Schaalia sp. 19OD2882]
MSTKKTPDPTTEDSVRTEAATTELHVDATTELASMGHDETPVVEASSEMASAAPDRTPLTEATPAASAGATTETASSAASSSAAMPAAPAPASAPSTVKVEAPVSRPEAPARGIRVGQALWASVVLLTGLLLIGTAFLQHVDLPMILISMVAALGVGLIVLALFVGRAKKG